MSSTSSTQRQALPGSLTRSTRASGATRATEATSARARLDPGEPEHGPRQRAVVPAEQAPPDGAVPEVALEARLHGHPAIGGHDGGDRRKPTRWREMAKPRCTRAYQRANARRRKTPPGVAGPSWPGARKGSATVGPGLTRAGWPWAGGRWTAGSRPPPAGWR